jgi:5-methyltetrahydropteroyltriglutamate--homocysteine methyltransferase
LPTEQVGSSPRPAALIDAIKAFDDGRLAQQQLDAVCDTAVRSTIQSLEATGSPVISDGEQGKQSFATYAIAGLKNVAPNGVPIPFADGHTTNFPRPTAVPLRCRTPADVYLADVYLADVYLADVYLERARRYAHVPVKQAIISPSALSLLYPQSGINGYSRQDDLDDLLDEREGEIRRCLQKGAHVVQIDFTEGRLSVKLDPSRRLLESFIDLNSLLIERFSDDTPRSRETAFAKVRSRVSGTAPAANMLAAKILGVA